MLFSTSIVSFISLNSYSCRGLYNPYRPLVVLFIVCPHSVLHIVFSKGIVNSLRLAVKCRDKRHRIRKNFLARDTKSGEVPRPFDRP